MAEELKIVATADVAHAVNSLDKLNKSLTNTASAAGIAASAASKTIAPISSNIGVFDKLKSGVEKAKEGLEKITESFPVAGIAVELFADVLLEAVRGLFEVDQAAAAMSESFDQAFQPFANATAEVSKLTEQIGLAKKGFLEKDEVLKVFNTTIGKTVGLAKDLNEAEAILISKGDAYIRLQALKAISNFAFQKSAEASVQAMAIQAKFNKSEGLLGIAVKKANKELGEQVDIFQNIGKNAENLIAALSKEFNLNPFGTNKLEKEVKLKISKPKKEEIERDIKSFKNDVEEALGGGLDVLVNPQFDFGASEAAGTQLGQQVGKNISSGIAEGINSGAADIGEAIDPALQALANTLTGVLEDTIESSLVNVGNVIGDTIGKALTGGAINVQDIFGGVFQIIGDGLKAFGKALIEYGIALKVIKIAIKNPVTAILAGIGLIAAGAILQSAVPRFATGTTNAPGGLTLVGERGPELIGLPRGSSVSSNGQTLAMGNGSGNGGYIASLKVSGADFIVMLKKANEQQSRNGGTTLF